MPDSDVWRLREAGLSLRAVARELDMSVGSVRRAIARQPVQPIESDLLAMMRAKRCAAEEWYHTLCSCRSCPHGYAKGPRVFELPGRRRQSVWGDFDDDE